MRNIPRDWFGGLKDHWKSDLVAAFSVAMVALPLALGVAIASGAEPMAGIISVVIGGLVATLFRSSAIAINGPAAGLISVTFASIMLLDDGSGNAYNYALAAFIVSGAIQVVLGVFRLGKLGNYFPSSVIVGIMAAIGVIIFAKQAHVAMNTTTSSQYAIDVLLEIPRQLSNLNPFVFIIAVICLLFLWYYPRIHNRLILFIPAPMWVLIISIPLGLLFGFSSGGSSILGDFSDFNLSEKLLISIPSNLLGSIAYPDFSRINEGTFWLAVLPISIISFIQTMAMTKAVDRLDPYSRQTNLSRDLMGVGIGTMASAAIGGLPLITVIVRSTVNVTHGGVTRWSNFFHGLIILIFVLVLSPILMMVPLAALAAILMFTGYKLAGPKVYKDAFLRGWEQLAIVLTTLFVTLLSDLLLGILAGFVITIFIQYEKVDITPQQFFRRIWKPRFTLLEKSEKNFEMKVRGIANFMTHTRIFKPLEEMPDESQITIDLSQCRLVDATFQENLYEFARLHNQKGGTFYIIGLNKHKTSSRHPYALKIKDDNWRLHLNNRQKGFSSLAKKHDWDYQSRLNWDYSYLRNFHFFQIRPIEYKENVISGNYRPHMDVDWEISDLTFDEGITSQAEVHRCTVQVIKLPFRIPQFSLDKDGFLDAIFEPNLKFAGMLDIDLVDYPKFNNKFMLRGRSAESLSRLFKDDMVDYFMSHDIYHIECNGEALLIFQDDKLRKIQEVRDLINYSYELCVEIVSAAEKSAEGNKSITGEELLERNSTANPI